MAEQVNSLCLKIHNRKRISENHWQRKSLKKKNRKGDNEYKETIYKARSAKVNIGKKQLHWYLWNEN